MQRILLLVFTLLLWNQKTTSQVFDYEIINQKNGLPSSTITSIIQDSRNLLWIGTDGAGFVRYDGTNFIAYNEYKEGSNFFVTDIIEDANNNIIVSTKYNGVMVFDGENIIHNFSKKNNHFNGTVTKLVNRQQKVDWFNISNEFTTDIDNVDISKYDLVLLDYEYLGTNKIDKIAKNNPSITFLIMLNSNTNFNEIKERDNIQIIVKPVKIDILKNLLNGLENKKTKSKKKKNTSTNNEIIKFITAEDNKINLLLTKTLISKEYPFAKIYEATNGAEAVKLYQEKQPDIVLMDIQMPVMNGYEATKEIRKMNPKAIIIALTAGAIAGEKEKCLDIGMNDFILKPIDKTVFDNTILKWIKTL